MNHETRSVVCIIIISRSNYFTIRGHLFVQCSLLLEHNMCIALSEVLTIPQMCIAPAKYTHNTLYTHTLNRKLRTAKRTNQNTLAVG